MCISPFDLLRISPLSVDMQEYDLAILVLVSILHYYQRRSYSPDLSTSMFLLRHNLLLVEPVTSQLVLDCLQGGLQPTVDCSAYLSIPFQRQKIRFFDFLCLIRLPRSSACHCFICAHQIYETF